MYKKMNPLRYKFLGVLPYSYNHQGNVVFLLGQERFETGFSDSLLWSGFGGRPEPEDSNVYQGASREAWEESMGFLGSQEELYLKLVQSDEMYTGGSGGITFLLKIPFDNNIHYLYKNIYNYIRKSYPIHLAPKGFYEKIDISWFSSTDIIHQRNKMRPSFYKSFINLVVPSIK